MALKMRPTGLGHGVYKDIPDYGIYCGGWCIGRIYETRTGPEGLPWFWAFHVPSKPGEPRTDRKISTNGTILVGCGQRLFRRRFHFFFVGSSAGST